ncbi:MAG: alpha-amylase family glycosyl hydrolase [Pseudomonadota bacterium]
MIRALAVALLLGACASAPVGIPSFDHAPEPYVKIEHPEWTRDAVIYQINTRQFTPEGTFAAAQDELPRLKTLGVDILWLMPIHPIGEVNRKGSLGSPYAVKDYFAVNPEFGTLEDFQSFVDAAHNQGFHVILDWVANHTAWDNPLLEQHPGWYERDWKGDPHPTPWTDWADIIDLDYSNPDLRKYMASALRYWVEEIGIDGYRADVAGFVPLDFWEDVRAELDSVKPVFMLAEWQTRDLHARAFDATYAWAWKEAAQDIAKGHADAGRMTGYYSELVSTWPHDAMRMLYTSNHDQNAWDGVASEIYGESLETFMVLSFISEGIPTIYNGQEAGNAKQLEFFEKDPIVWRDHPHAALIAQLTQMKSDTPPLHNAAWGGRTSPVTTDNPQQLLSFMRGRGDTGVLALFNLSPDPATATLVDGAVAGEWCPLLNGERETLAIGDTLTFEAWGWRALSLCET